MKSNQTFDRANIPSWNMFGSRYAILLPDRSIVSNFGNDPNASCGKLSIEFSAKFKYTSDPPRPENESDSMQSIWFPLRSKYFNFFKFRNALDGTSTNWLWCNDNSHSDRSRPLNAFSTDSSNFVSCNIWIWLNNEIGLNQIRALYSMRPTWNFAQWIERDFNAIKSCFSMNTKKNHFKSIHCF